MAPIAISFLASGLALVGILLGSIMQRMLPEGHLGADSKDVVKLSMGVVATLAALVLGLLVASAKSTYDARESEINQITAYVILLDTLLAKYGEEAQAARASLRQAVPPVVDRIGEKRNRCRCSQRHSRQRLRARLSISGFRSFNQATRSNADCRHASFRSPMI
jgi:hypothetical protein